MIELDAMDLDAVTGGGTIANTFRALQVVSLLAGQPIAAPEPPVLAPIQQTIGTSPRR